MLALPVTEVKGRGWSDLCLEFDVVGGIDRTNNELYWSCDRALEEFIAKGQRGGLLLGYNGSRLVNFVRLRLVADGVFVLQVHLAREPTQEELDLVIERIRDAGIAGVPGRDGLVTFTPTDFHFCRTLTTTTVCRHPVLSDGAEVSR